MTELVQAITTYLHKILSYSPLVVGVELLLLGLVVWWITRFLRGTRGARLLKGMVLILASVYVVIRHLPRNLGQVTLGWERLEFPENSSTKTRLSSIAPTMALAQGVPGGTSRGAIQQRMARLSSAAQTALATGLSSDE